MILADDDRLLDNYYLKKAMDYFYKYKDLSIVGSTYEKYNTINNIKTIIRSNLKDITDGIDYLVNRFNPKIGGIFIGSAVFNRSKAIKTNPFNLEAPYADGEFIDKLALLGRVGGC